MFALVDKIAMNVRDFDQEAYCNRDML